MLLYFQMSQYAWKGGFVLRRSLMKKSEFIGPIQFEYNTNLLSKESFDQHLILYNNYINKINEKIHEPSIDSYSLNAIRLHEMFFQNISNENNTASDFMNNLFEENFGGFHIWRDNFVEISKSTKGSNWCILIYDTITKSFKNISVKNHADGMVLGCIPIIVLDMWEHSFYLDFHTNKSNYIEKFFENINYSVVEKRIKDLNLS